VIATRALWGSEMHTLKEIESWIRHRDEWVWGHERLTRPLRTTRAKSRFWRTK
jgi:hypothetical protein